MIQRSAEDLRAPGSHPPLDKSLPPAFIHHGRGIEFIKLGNNVKVMNSPTYQGKKNKMKETSIIKVKLPVD